MPRGPGIALARASKTGATAGVVRRIREAIDETPIPLFVLFGTRVGKLSHAVTFDPEEGEYVAEIKGPSSDFRMWELLRDGDQRSAYQIAWDREGGSERGIALLQLARMLYLAEGGEQ